MPSQGLFLTRQFYSFLPHLAMGIKKLYPHRGYLILHGIEIFTVHTHSDFAVHVGFCLQKSRQRRTLQSMFGNITKYSNVTINSIGQRPVQSPPCIILRWRRWWYHILGKNLCIYVYKSGVISCGIGCCKRSPYFLNIRRRRERP